MGRLIDADASRDDFVESVYEILSDEPDNIKANLIIELFDDMETAYDVDKVVEELKEAKEKGYAELTMLEVNELMDKAINIVRKGGV